MTEKFQFVCLDKRSGKTFQPYQYFFGIQREGGLGHKGIEIKGVISRGESGPFKMYE